MDTKNFEQILKSGQFIGIVEDNKDPDKKQRVRVRIPYLHSSVVDIPTSSLPWCQPMRDMNGLTFVVPDLNKVVYVTFPDGNLYFPVYEQALHLNINLQKKIEQYDGDDYTNFIALCYNYNTQIWIENEKGLNIIHKFNGINITKDQIALNLKDNQSTMYLGDDKGNQEIVLGTNFMEWMDTLVQTLLDAYIGNLGAPAIANPELIQVISQYTAKRQTFLSQHIYATDNNQIRSKDFDVIGQVGDDLSIDSKKKQLNIQVQPIDYKPKSMVRERGIDEINSYVAPPTDGSKSDEGQPPTQQVQGQLNSDVDRMVRYLQSQGYKVYTEPYRLNIIGIRNKLKDSGTITNRFDDWIWTFFKTSSGDWDLRKYNVTTTPGLAPGSNSLPSGPNNSGVAMLVYGQFENKWKVGYHQNRTGKPGGKLNRDGTLAPEHKALCYATTAHIRNDSNGATYIIPGSKSPQTQAIGINIHHAGETTSSSVWNWSEGCVCFASKAQHVEFMSLCNQQEQQTKFGGFTFTLVPQREFDIFT